jgi:hypothetical protein
MFRSIVKGDDSPPCAKENNIEDEEQIQSLKGQTNMTTQHLIYCSGCNTRAALGNDSALSKK